MTIEISQKRADFILIVENISDLEILNDSIQYSHRVENYPAYDKFMLKDIEWFKIIV